MGHWEDLRGTMEPGRFGTGVLQGVRPGALAQRGHPGPAPQAVAELGWGSPTSIQAEAIPLALEGRDLLVRARTGSGKTGAYGLPLLQHLLRAREVSGDREARGWARMGTGDRDWSAGALWGKRAP